MYLSFNSNATSRDTDWLRAVLMCYTDWQIILLSQIYSCICHTLTILGERLMPLNALITSPVLTATQSPFLWESETFWLFSTLALGVRHPNRLSKVSSKMVQMTWIHKFCS